MWVWAYPRCRHIGPPRDLCLVSHCALSAHCTCCGGVIIVIGKTEVQKQRHELCSNTRTSSDRWRDHRVYTSSL